MSPSVQAIRRFLEAHDRAVAFGQGQRKSEIGVCRTVLTVFRRQTEVAETP